MTGLCATGKSQSPIDIVTDYLVDVDSNDDIVKVVTSFGDITGNFIRVGLPSMTDQENGHGMMKINEDLFTIMNVNFHIPTEHTVNGERYDLELHLFGSTESGKLFESAIFFEEGEENEAIRDILDSVGSDMTTTFNLNKFYDEGKLDKYYYYVGSISAPFPDCTENTPWVIMEEVQEVSAEQLEEFREYLDEGTPNGRYRNIQPINGRKVYHYDDDSALYLAQSFFILAFFLL